MQYDPITSLASIKSELEGTWKNFDDVYATFNPRDWLRKFGKTWTYADQPYHLGYFDRFHADYVAKGTNVSPKDKVIFRTARELDDWNAREFAKRPASQTVEQSLGQMRASRDMVRQQLNKMTDASLDGKVWSSLLGGWVPARQIFQGIIIHNVGEYTKLLLRLGRKEPALSPSSVHLRLKLMMKFMTLTLNHEAASNARFTQAWNFTGPGGGGWTFNVLDGSCKLSEGLADNPDLTITMTPANFHKLILKITPPPLLMLTGQMKVKGLRNMGTFGKLFPEPKPDDVLLKGEEGIVLG
jgi:hypothetical protein